MANSTFTKSLDMLNTIGLRESIETLMKKESKYIPVATVCKTYLKKLDEGMHEEEIANDFVNDLSRVAVHESAKDALFVVSKKLDENKRDIDMINNLHNMSKGQYSYIVPMIESSLVNYMTDKNADTRTAARQSLSLFEGIKEINAILETLSFDEYEEKTNQTLHNVSLNESMIPQAPKTFSQEEVDKLLAEAKAEQTPVKVAKKLSDIDTHINLDYTIKRILKNSTNEGLKAYCEQYINALNSGKAEETLYESFISGISRWNYLSAVDTETSALKDRISKYQQDIDLKKILRVMEGTGSYYIVPLIENVVVDYMDNKSMTNKTILKQRLQAFEYDPFVRDILNVVMLDQSLENTVYLGESVEKINNIVHTEKVYSPVKYVKENECIFNVKGTYYTRKGNTITKLAKSNIENLDESFKTLCNLINHPAVNIDGENNMISIYEGSDVAKITETSIEINGKPVSESELDTIANNSHLMNEHKEGFYAATKMINENFDKIAYIDFVKRLSMNESSNGKSVDVFRIKNNIFVNTSNAALGTSTFYRNVNPIQCRSYINEHMELNVSPLFEDILPNQHAILEGIEETKKQYEDYIDELNSKKEEFEKMKDSSDDTKDIEDAIKLIDDELKDVQKKYDEYQKDSEKYVTGDEKDAEEDDPSNPAQFEPTEEPSDEEPAETEDQMTQPISGDAPTENPAEDAFVDPDQEAIDSATPYDPDFDVAAGSAAGGKEDVQVLRVSYATNVKTGKMLNQGTAFVVIPSVDANGDIKDETKTVTFYLDANRKPILNNEYMPLSVYNAIVSAISADSDTANVEVAGATDNIEAAGDEGSPATTDTPEGMEDLLGGNPDSNVEASLTVTASAPATEEPAAEPVSPEGPAVEEPAAEPTAEPDAPAAEDNLNEPIGEVPPQEEVDNMFGVNPEDETDDIPAPEGGYIDFDNDEPTEEPAAEPAAEEPAPEDGVDAAEPSLEEPATEEPIEAAPQEGPAQAEENAQDATYPIELGLNMEDIKPIKKESFIKECGDMCIECAMVEGDDDSVTLKFANKAAVYALKDYFKEWKNFSDTQFITFFPELEKCFKNQPKVPVAPKDANESVKILGVNAINESVLYSESNKGTVKIVLPYTDDYAKMFNQKKTTKASHIEIVTESYDETRDLYNTLNNYSARMNGNIDSDAKEFLTKYAKDFKDIADSDVYTLNVPFNGFLEQKLESKGIHVSRVDENLSIAVDKNNVNKAKKVFESVYGDKTPIDVKNFFQLSEKSLKEGVVITVEDTKTGKTVKIDTSNLDSDNSSEEEKEEADPFKDVTTTFNASDSALFKSEDEDSDEGKDEEKDEEKKDENVEGQNEGEESSEETKEETSEESSEESSEEESKEEKKKPKFKFRAKKSSNESVKTPVKNNVLNEAKSESPCQKAEPNVMDYVILNNGMRGQILSKLPMSNNFVVVTDEGRTIEVSPKEMKLANQKFDCVQAPYKFDPATLKGLFEQMVHCGLFMNGNQLTPNNCYVKYSEYINAKDDDDIRMIIENQQTFAKKKYVKITEDVNDFANVNEYVEGVEVASNGAELRNILFNIKDYEHATGSATPVRVLVTDETGDKSLIYLPANSVRPVEM